MGKKKTVFVWILIVLLAISIIFGLINAAVKLIDVQNLLKPSLLSNPAVNLIGLVLSIVVLIIEIIYYAKLYNVRPDVIRWTHIAFGVSVASTLLQFILSFMTVGLLALFVSPLIPVVLLITVGMWIGITLHLKRAQKDNLMDFS